MESKLHVPCFGTYRCDGCKQLVPATKQMTIYDDPNILVVHLKRFDGILGGKISRHIRFSDVLDLEPHMCPSRRRLRRSSSSGGTSSMCGTMPHSSQQSVCSQAPSMYHLHGVLIHQGYSANSGHYYAYVKDGVPPHGHWHCMNDASVYRVAWPTVENQAAYMLFYVRSTMKQPAVLPEHSEHDARPQASATANGAHHAEVSSKRPAGFIGPQLPPGLVKRPRTDEAVAAVADSANRHTSAAATPAAAAVGPSAGSLAAVKAPACNINGSGMDSSRVASTSAAPAVAGLLTAGLTPGVGFAAGKPSNVTRIGPPRKIGSLFGVPRQVLPVQQQQEQSKQQKEQAKQSNQRQHQHQEHSRMLPVQQLEAKQQQQEGPHHQHHHQHEHHHHHHQHKHHEHHPQQQQQQQQVEIGPLPQQVAGQAVPSTYIVTAKARSDMVAESGPAQAQYGAGSVCASHAASMVESGDAPSGLAASNSSDSNTGTHQHQQGSHLLPQANGCVSAAVGAVRQDAHGIMQDQVKAQLMVQVRASSWMATVRSALQQCKAQGLSLSQALQDISLRSKCQAGMPGEIKQMGWRLLSDQLHWQGNDSGM